MKLNEIIELNGEELTLELNRDSFLKIDEYCNVQKSFEKINDKLYEFKDENEINEDEDPFANTIDTDEYLNEIEEKERLLERTITRAFWIWLYPNYKYSIKKVEEMLEPYFNDDDKANFIGEKYGEFMKKSINIRENYIEERKNLKAQAKK